VILTVVLQLLVVYVPPLQTIFGTSALPALDVLVATGAAASVLLLVEAWKWRYRRGTTSRSAPETASPVGADHAL
jgi:P-type Ca2+ transporter type 2C